MLEMDGERTRLPRVTEADRTTFAGLSELYAVACLASMLPPDLDSHATRLLSASWTKRRSMTTALDGGEAIGASKRATRKPALLSGVPFPTGSPPCPHILGLRSEV